MERNNVCRIIFLSPTKLIQQCRLTCRFCVFLITLNLSNDAKVLYAMLLDRAGISKENGYIETDGAVRLYFTVQEAKEKLHRSRQVTTRAFQELERSGLVVRRKQGLGKVTIHGLGVANSNLFQLLFTAWEAANSNASGPFKVACGEGPDA